LLDTQHGHVAGGKLTIFTDIASAPAKQTKSMVLGRFPPMWITSECVVIQEQTQGGEFPWESNYRVAIHQLQPSACERSAPHGPRMRTASREPD